MVSNKLLLWAWNTVNTYTYIHQIVRDYDYSTPPIYTKYVLYGANFLAVRFGFSLFYYYSLCFWFWIWCSCFSSEFSCFVVANTIRHVNMKISWAHVTTRAVRWFCYFVHYFLSISNLCRLMRLIIHTNKISLVDLLIRLFFIWEWFSSVKCLWMLNLALHRSRTKTKQNY